MIAVLFGISMRPAYAQTSSACPGLGADRQPLDELYQNVNGAASATDDPGSHSYRTNQNSTASLIGTVSNGIYGPGCTVGNTAAVRAMPEEERRAGLLNSMSTAMTAMFYDPISVDIPTHYANMLLPREWREGVDFPAYAATGDGAPSSRSAIDFYNDLNINKLWGISFSISMLGFIIVLLYAGFMIMFRTKIGGQAVVTVSMSLQNMVIGIFLALASYALGGFFINLSKYLVLVVDGLMTGGPFNDFRTVFIMTPFTLIGKLGGAIDFGGAPGVKIDLFNLTGSFFESLGSILVWFIARIIVAFMVFTAGFKIFFSVFTTYARMLIDIIMAPIYFMVASLPGKQDGYMGWMKKMFKNSLVMPMTFLIVNLAIFISRVNIPSGASPITAVTGGAINLGDGGTSGICAGGITDCPDLNDMLLQSAGPKLIVAIMILLMAPAASSILDELLGTGASKAASAASDPIKKAASGVPLVGGFFK